MEHLVLNAARIEQFAGRIMYELASIGRLPEDARLADFCEAIMLAEEFVSKRNVDGTLRELLSISPVKGEADQLRQIAHEIRKAGLAHSADFSVSVTDRLEAIASRLSGVRG